MLTLQGRADAKGTPASFSWGAISQMLKNQGGVALDYDAFKNEYDSNPNLQKLIDKFDERGIVVKTKEENPPAVGEKAQQHNGNGLDSMAKRAAQKIVNR